MSRALLLLPLLAPGCIFNIGEMLAHRGYWDSGRFDDTGGGQPCAFFLQPGQQQDLAFAEDIGFVEDQASPFEMCGRQEDDGAADWIAFQVRNPGSWPVSLSWDPPIDTELVLSSADGANQAVEGPSPVEMTILLGPDDEYSLRVRYVHPNPGSSVWTLTFHDRVPGPEPGDVFFTEYHPIPNGGPQWVEVFNAGDAPVDLGTMAFRTTFTGGIPIESAGALPLPPGEHAIISDDPTFVDIGKRWTTTQPFGLPGGNGTLTLEQNGDAIDSFSYSDATHQAQPGRSMALVAGRDADDNDEYENWCPSSAGTYDGGANFGSPGDPNPGCLP